jgi:predicted RNase H-like nuclease (RuvC/YqgF family)
MWIESFEDAKMSFEINENMIKAYEQAAIALKNLNKIDQAIDILKLGVSVDKNPNPFENKKNLKMFTLLEKFENEILKNLKIEKEKREEIINLKNIIVELKNNNNDLKADINNLKIENNNFKNEINSIKTEINDLKTVFNDNKKRKI